MKQMEYTIKVITDGPISGGALESALEGVEGVELATLWSYRVIPTKKAAKVTA